MLIGGETGTGKELVARAASTRPASRELLIRGSDAAARPTLVAIRCLSGARSGCRVNAKALIARAPAGPSSSMNSKRWA